MTMDEKKYKLFGEILKEKGLVTEEQFRAAYEEQKKTGEAIGSILVRMGIITNEQLSETLAEQYGLKVTNLSELDIPKNVIMKVSASMARNHKIIPIKQEGDVITLAVLTPLDLMALDKLRLLFKAKIQEVLVPENEFEKALKKYYGSEEENIDSMIEEITEGDITFVEKGEQKLAEGEMEAQEAPIVKLVNLLILDAFRSRASDIHIEPLEDKFRIRYRIDGVLHDMPGPPMRLKGPVMSRVKLLAGMNLAEKRLPQDGRIKINLGGKDVDLRVSALPGIYGESIVLRILDKSSILIGLEELGFLPEDKKSFERLIELPNGIILVTGPTGSGKTTTLNACLNTINRPDKKLVTVEDPVEYQVEGINQVQVKPQIDLTFAKVLRHILRQAPDVIMIGEIRDPETAEIAITAALTGHLVFSTLHTNDAAGAVTRLIDMGMKPFLIASSVQAILAQRLVRTICAKCKEPYQPHLEGLNEIKAIAGDISKVTFYHGRGCHECKNTGYKGRIGIFELLLVNDTIREMILESRPSTEIKQKAMEMGMRTLRQDGFLKALHGITTVTEVALVTETDVEALEV